MLHKDMTATNILRTKGTANLIAAAHQLDARRFLTQSMVFGYGYGDWTLQAPSYREGISLLARHDARVAA